jgi:serine/threonine-protein kinase
VLQKLLQHQGDEPPDPRGFRDDLPSDLIPILRTMMAKSPGKRYPSPAELCTDLVSFANRNGIPAVGSSGLVLLSTAEQEPPAWRRHLTWAVPLAILLVVTAFLHFYWTFMTPAEAPPPLDTPAAAPEIPSPNPKSSPDAGDSKVIFAWPRNPGVRDKLKA